MIAQLQPQLMTPQEYLEWEEQQPLKYEYINGEVFAMTGGTLPHNSIAVNLTSALKNHLPGKGCKVQMTDAKKFRNYRQIDTLKEYVLIECYRMTVECYRLNEKGKWELTSYSLEETTVNGTKLEVHFTSVDFRCPISLLYEDVVFPEDNLEKTSPF